MPTYEVSAPDGKKYLVDAPRGATQDQIIQYVQSQLGQPAAPVTAPPQPEQSGFFRQALDVPLQVARGGVGGIRMLADLFGAGSSASEALKSADTWLADLLSAEAQKDQRRVAQILKDAEDKGVLDQVKAGFQAFFVAPVDTLSQALGSTAPVLIAGLASGPVGAVLGTARLGAVAMPAVGAAMGVGEVKGSIYEAVEREYLNKGASPEMAKAKAQEAQSYASTNLPSLAVAGGLGALAGGVGVERPLVSLLSRGAVKDVAEQQALREAERGLMSRVGLGALKEGAPEFAQASQSQLAQNIALRSEGFDVPLFRNVFGAGAMEGAAGAILGGGLAVPRTGVERLPGQQEGESDSAFARRMSREIEAARRAEQPLAPVTPPAAPTEPVVSTAPEGEDVFRFPDGSVGTLDQARAYAMNLPPEQRASTLQSILTQRVPREKTVPPDLFTQTATQPATQPGEGAAPTKPVVAEKPAEEAKPEVVEPVKPPAVAMTKEEEEVAADAAKEKPVQNFILNYPIVELPLDQLSLSKEVPQFKGDADTEGIVEKLEGTFDQRGVAPIQVWRRNDGRLEIISGRHRFDLAKRSGDKLIRAQVHDEATGFDADQASILDAELNIRDQQGKGRDYVAYFRKSGISEEDASARGLLGRSPGKPAFAIAKNGSEELVGAHRADIVSDAGAAAIANAAPGDSRLQAVGVKAIQEGKSPLAAVNIIKAVQEVSKGRPAPEGGGDLFGFDDSAMREAEEMAKIATLKQNQLAQRLAAISGASRRPEIAKKEGIDIKDPDALKKREKELRQQRAAWDNWSSSPDLVQEIRKEMEPKAEKPEEKPSVRETEPVKEAKEVPAEIQAKIDALGKALQRIMSRYGLRDVALRLVADMKAEGEYASKVLSLALDAVDPVVALRHEAIHALKELGFFTPAQWKSLERQAKEKWVDQYLKKKNVNRQPLQEGQMSRYDAYMKFYGGDEEAMLEEAIADAFADFRATKAPPGMLQALVKKLWTFFQSIKEAFGAEPDAERIFKKVERGELRAGPVAPDSWKDSEKEDADAEKYEEQNGILPYTSAGQIEVPVETPKLSIKAPYGEKELAKGKENHPVLNVPLNANGTVTLYFPTSNLSAREVAKTKRLKATSPTSNRIYLTNESNPAAVRTRAGNIDQGPIEANVMVQVPPEMLQFDMEHSDGRKDFFIQLAEGNAFAEKMKMTKLFTLYKPRSEAIAKTTTIGDIGKGLESAISAYKQLSPADQRAKLAQARQVLKDEHNVGTLLGENGKLQKTRLNEYQLPEDIQNSVASLGLGLASAQKINERNLSTCPQSARCEGLCLGETSGQNQLYGGDGPFRAGPRLSQYLKTEALVMHPEEFGIVLYDEIKKFESWAKSDKGFEVITEENGEKSRVKKQVYTPAIRLNVTSDFPPKMLKPFIEGFPGVRFYDYTKLATPGPIADNHHLTYSSDGAAQVVEGKTVGVGSNWDAMIKRLNNGFNVAMAFTSKRDMPDFVLDEKTGDKFQVWNGDNYDARFLDPRPGQKGNLFNKGMIIGLTNKDRTGRPEDAALRHDGFFVDYDRQRDGNTVVIRDQEKIKAGKKIIPIAKPSLRETDATWSDRRIDKLINDYGYIDGRTFGIAAYVNPQDFIGATTPSKEFADEIKAEAGKLDREQIARQSQTPFLEWDIEKGVIIGHEGRHRMAAMAAEGVESAPVVLYVKDRFGSKKPDQYERRDSVEIKGQRFQSGRGLSLTATKLIPLEYRQTKALKEEFGGESKVKFSLRDKLGLYSELEAKVSQGPGKGTAEAWKGYINGLTQKGVKPEEIEWSGVRDWLDLQKGSVTKEDLLAYLKNGGVQVEETVLGGREPWRERLDLLETRGYRNLSAAEKEELEELRDRFDREGPTTAPESSQAQYSQYSLPGGENYREVLLTIPDISRSEHERAKRAWVSYQEQMQEKYNGSFAWRRKATKEENAEADRLIAELDKAAYGAPQNRPEYRSSHWKQPNVLAHIRVNDRTDAEGNKVLFVEEIQSDWGQEGKKKGFIAGDWRESFKEWKRGLRERAKLFYLDAADTEEERATAIRMGEKLAAREDIDSIAKVMDERRQMEEAWDKAVALRDRIPAAPFVTKTEGWLNLALKRIMVMAGEGGYDKVAFVNGDQSAERYDLSKQVDSISYEPTGKGYSINVMAGGRNVKDGNFTRSELEDIVGVEIVKKMDAREGKQPFDPEVEPALADTRELSGLDLRVGGEGMKTFYDTIVPTAVKKLLPKVGGGQMTDVNLLKDSMRKYDKEVMKEDLRRLGEGGFRAKYAHDQQPGFDVTPAMKERVRTTGLPRFSLRDTVNVDGTERPTTSSTNKPIYPNEEGTKNFWRWFKDSAVVDGDGRPLVVYHGTAADFSEFMRRPPQKAIDGLDSIGSWFTDNRARAQDYGPVTMPSYLSLKNPLVLDSFQELRDLWKDSQPTRGPAAKAHKANRHWGSSDAFLDEMYGLYDGIIIKKHGNAEWKDQNAYIAFRPEQIKSAIGNVGKFDPVDPSIKASLRDTTDPVTRARVDQITTPREEKSFIKRITEAIAPKSASSFRAAFLDRYNRLSEYDKELVRLMGGAPLLADASSHGAALMSDLSAGVLAGAMGVHDGVGGIPVYVNGHTKIVNNNNTVKGPIAIFAPLAKYNDPFIYQKYQTWAAINRGIRLYGQGRETGIITPADRATAAQILKDHPEFKDIHDEWIKFNNGLVQYLKDTGVLSEEAAKEFVKYSDYIPFYRQADGEETVGPQIFASLSGVRAPKKLKKSDLPIGEFLETVVRNVQYSIEAGMKNVAAQRAVNTAVAIGQANRLNYVSSAPNVVKVLENGKTSYYETKDMLFVEAMKSLNLGDLPFIGLLAGPANVLRNLVTKDPAFMLANMMRDSVSAWVSSGVKMTPMVDTMTNFGKALRGQNPEYSALLNSGVIGGYDYSQGVEISARRFDRALRKKAGIYTTGEKLARPFTSLWDALETGTQASDAATRMEVYKKTLAATGNEAEALFRAVEVMNFNRKGNNPLVRVLTAAVPFLNARMQGLDVLYRAAFGKGTEANAKEIQTSFFIRGMTIAALSTMYWMLVHEDDEWKKQEQETRDNYWILGDVKIPIPFEIGVLFKVIPERILEYSFGDDTGKDFLKSMARQLTSTLAFNPIPQTALPIVESVTNYSFFTQRPIVSQGLESVAPAYQVGPSTSRLAELAGEASKGLPTALQLSPMKVDQMIRGYTGTLGGYMVDLFDAIYDMNSDSPKASKRFEQMPVIKRFAVDPEARGQVTAYYELKNSVDEAVRTANLLERSMKPQDWADYVQENQGLFLTKDYVLDMEKSMKDFREMKTFVRASDMDADEKRDITLNITTMENNMASNIQHIKKMIAAQ
jgi:hypothetical protein